MSSIGKRIRDVRVAKGLTQTSLAGNGISSGYVSLIESGKRTPSTKMVKEIATRLGVSADELLASDAERSSDRVRVDVNFARMALANGNPTEALRLMSTVDIAGLDSLSATEAASVLAESLGQTGDIQGAVATLRALVDRSRREQSWTGLARAAATLVVTLCEYGDVHAAVDVASRALDEVEDAALAGTDEHIRLGAAYVWALFARGDTLTATQVVEQLMEVADRVGSARARGSIYWNAAIVAQGRGSLDDAVRLTDRAVALLSEQAESSDVPRLRLHYAWLLLHHERPDAVEALAQLDRAEQYSTIRDSKLDLGTSATLRGRAFLVLGELDDAAEHAARALQLLGPSEHVDRTAALILLGDVGAARFEADLADESYREARKVLSGMQASREVARLWRQLGDSLRRIGDQPGALHAYDASLTLSGLPKTPQTSRVRILQDRVA
jgi:ATP/maltotriose-dependent transcriptional regulator MalT